MSLLSASTGKFDHVPNIRAAGRLIALGPNEGAEYCVKADLYKGDNNNPGTPEHVKRYRKSFQNQPGVKQIHPGQVGDNIPINQFGRKTFQSEHVDQVIKSQNLKGLADKFNDIKEGKYASNIREPLAQSYVRGYNWPNQAQNGEFQFGVQSITPGTETVKDILTAGVGIVEDENVRKMYIKTHGNFASGEQKERGYTWNFDKTAHRFGYGEQRLINGAAMSVHAERFENSFPKTVIVKKTVEDVKAVTSDMLGQSKNLGQGKPPVNDDHVFGVKNIVGNDIWNAAKCIHGEPTEKEVQPDKDLGRCTKPGSMNVVRKPEDWNRSFGTPSIRTDIPFKEKRSVADYNNYGDEPEAVDLLFPSTFTELGISEYDFQLPRTRDEIKMLFERIGFSYKIGKFNTMYNRAKEFMSNSSSGNPASASGDTVSVRAFMQAVRELHSVE